MRVGEHTVIEKGEWSYIDRAVARQVWHEIPFGRPAFRARTCRPVPRAEPGTAALGVVVLDPHPDDGRDVRQAVEHRADEARSRRPTSVEMSMKSRRVRASAAERTGVLPSRTTCFGPLTAAAGLKVRAWPTTR